MKKADSKKLAVERAITTQAFKEFAEATGRSPSEFFDDRGRLSVGAADHKSFLRWLKPQTEHPAWRSFFSDDDLPVVTTDGDALALMVKVTDVTPPPIRIEIPHDLLSLIDKATAALDSARTSAEVLEARDLAKMAYDQAKSTARIAKAKQAHDSLIMDVHQAQAHALTIRARAEMRLAEEYDQAQIRGEVKRNGGNRSTVEDRNTASAADLGIRRDEIHEARKLRDAEAAAPGIVQATINKMLERGEEQTSAALRREIIDKPPPKRMMDPRALWLWGTLLDFKRDHIIDAGADHLAREMTEPMRAQAREAIPKVIEFLKTMETTL